MRQTQAWLDAHTAAAPPSLRQRMSRAVAEVTVPSSDVPSQLGEAALLCLAEALRKGSDRTGALDLLAADALLTAGCEAAAELGTDAVQRFAADYGAARLGELVADGS